MNSLTHCIIWRLSYLTDMADSQWHYVLHNNYRHLTLCQWAWRFPKQANSSMANWRCFEPWFEFYCIMLEVGLSTILNETHTQVGVGRYMVEEAVAQRRRGMRQSGESRRRGQSHLVLAWTVLVYTDQWWTPLALLNTGLWTGPILQFCEWVSWPYRF